MQVGAEQPHLGDVYISGLKFGQTALIHASVVVERSTLASSNQASHWGKLITRLTRTTHTVHTYISGDHVHTSRKFYDYATSCNDYITGKPHSVYSYMSSDNLSSLHSSPPRKNSSRIHNLTVPYKRDGATRCLCG